MRYPVLEKIAVHSETETAREAELYRSPFSYRDEFIRENEADLCVSSAIRVQIVANEQ
jgi:hypothetical protein